MLIIIKFIIIIDDYCTILRCFFFLMIIISTIIVIVYIFFFVINHLIMFVRYIIFTYTMILCHIISSNTTCYTAVFIYLFCKDIIYNI